MELVGTDSNLVTSTAMSTIQNSNSIRMNLFKKKKNKHGSGSSDKTLKSSTSSVTCPLHLLVTSLILSDGTILGTHHVPQNHLRISSYGTDYVWDPAVSIENSKTNFTNTYYNLSVSLNSIVIWPALLSATNYDETANVFLGMMDEVIMKIKENGMLKDPGPPKNLQDWIVDNNIPLLKKTNSKVCFY